MKVTRKVIVKPDPRNFTEMADQIAQGLIDADEGKTKLAKLRKMHWRLVVDAMHRVGLNPKCWWVEVKFGRYHVHLIKKGGATEERQMAIDMVVGLFEEAKVVDGRTIIANGEALK